MKSAWKLSARLILTFVVGVCLAVPNGHPARADQRQQIIDTFANEAKALDQNFQGFLADRGRILFSSSPAMGKPDTPSCTTCHTTNPAHVGQTRAGKEIAPMALSKTPDRYGDLEKVEKWFRRNCKSVLGRTCTPIEKGDYLTFMFTQ